MFDSNRIKLDKEMMAKLRKYSAAAGYSSVEEFVRHALEKELAKLEDADSDEEIQKRLRGLGTSLWAGIATVLGQCWEISSISCSPPRRVPVLVGLP
jgi:predicted DNA-binding protein